MDHFFKLNIIQVLITANEDKIEVLGSHKPTSLIWSCKKMFNQIYTEALKVTLNILICYYTVQKSTCATRKGHHYSY